MKHAIKLLGLVVLAGLLAAPLQAVENAEPVRAVSGRLVGGLRILPVPANEQNLQLTVYRGDYIKFKPAEASGPSLLSIPALNIRQTLPADQTRAPYFKMKQTGTFAFTLGHTDGRITVIHYHQSQYTEVSAARASEIIAARAPLILDVRTAGEYKRGRLQNAALIPVQVLEKNLDKLAAYKGREILIYCATGNRSTVASKILIDNGFNRILNLRYGIVDWQKRKFPIVP